MVDLALGPAPLTGAPARLWRAPAIIGAAFAAFAVWYFWSWALSAGEAGWIAALFVVPPLLVGGLIAGLIRLAVAGLGHDALRDLRTVLYGARRARRPAFARLFDALLAALFGAQLISVRSLATGLAIAAAAFLASLTLWALVVPGDAFTLLVESGPASRLGADPRASTLRWFAWLFLAGAPATLVAFLGVRLAARSTRRWFGLPLLFTLGIVLPLAVAVFLLGASHAWFQGVPSLVWIIHTGLLDVLRPTVWTFREPAAAAIYLIFLPSALFVALAYGLPTVRLLAHGAGPSAALARQHPVRAAMFVLLAMCFVINTALVMARAEATAFPGDSVDGTGTHYLAEQDRLFAQAQTLMFGDRERTTLYRLTPGAVRVTIAGDQDVYGQHRDAVADNLATFSRLTGRGFTLDPLTNAAHTLTIAFVPTARISTWGWRSGPALQAALARRALCRTLPRQGRIYIGSDLPGDMIRHCIAHELAHYVGLFGHACLARPSVLCGQDEPGGLTEADTRIIAALYGPSLANGMPRDLALKVISQRLETTNDLDNNSPGY